MEQKINIAEILKDAPKGTKLYSPLCGECELEEVLMDREFSIQVCPIGTDNNLVTFTKFGEFDIDYIDTECLLFPSKDNRDWSTFQAPWKHKHFEPFQEVLVKVRGVWNCDLYSHYSTKFAGHVTLSLDNIADCNIIPYEGNEYKRGKEVKDA